MKNVENIVRERVRRYRTAGNYGAGDQVWNKVGNQVWNKVRDPIGEQTSDQLWIQVIKQVQQNVKL
jgi:hypothetical protein